MIMILIRNIFIIYDVLGAVMSSSVCEWVGDGDDLYIIGAVCVSVCHENAESPYSRDLVVSHVYRHFPYSRYFVISPVYRHHIPKSV